MENEMNVTSCSFNNRSMEFVIAYDHPEDMTKPWIRETLFIPIVLVYSLCLVIGSAGNALFMWAMQCDRKGRSATGMFLVSLAVADFLLLLSAPTDVASYFVRSSTGGNVSCKIVGYSRMLSAFSTVLNLMAITVERFIVIVYPMRSRQFCTMKNCKRTLVLIWTLAVLMALPSLFTWEVQSFYYGKFDNNSKLIEASVVNVLFCEEASIEDGQIMSIYHLIFLFILPLTVQSLCYSKMIEVLWSSTTDVYLTSHAGGTSGNAIYKMSRSPSVAGVNKAMLPSLDVSHVSHVQHVPSGVKMSLLTNQRLSSDRTDSATAGYVMEQTLSGRQLSRDLTGYQFCRNRTESLAFTECPLRRAGQQNKFLQMFSCEKRNSDARYKSSTSLANNGLEQQPLKQHNLDLKHGRRQVIKMLVAVNIAFMFCWGPLVVFDVLRLYGDISYGKVAYLTKIIVKLLPYTHCCLNPIIYGFMSKNFRKALRKACLSPSSCVPSARRPSSSDETRTKSNQIFNGNYSSSQLTPKSQRHRLDSGVNF